MNTRSTTFRRLRVRTGVFAAIAAAAVLTGCGTPPSQITTVDPIGGRGSLTLEPHDVVLAMRRAGFNDEQILELGPAIRNGLAVKGGARVSEDNLTRAMFMVHGDEIYGVALDRGTFRYLPGEGAVDDLAPPPEKAITPPAQ